MRSVSSASRTSSTFCFQGQTALCQYVERDPRSNTLDARVQSVPEHRASEGQRHRPRSAVPGTPAMVRRKAADVRHPCIRAAACWSERTSRRPARREVHLEGGFDVSGANGPVLYPRWKGNMSVAYSVGPLDGAALGRVDLRSKINVAWVEGVDVDDNWLPNYFNTNFKLGYRATCSAITTSTSRLRHEPVRQGSDDHSELQLTHRLAECQLQLRRVWSYVCSGHELPLVRSGLSRRQSL